VDEAQLKSVRHRCRVIIGQQNSVKELKEVKYDQCIVLSLSEKRYAFQQQVIRVGGEDGYVLESIVDTVITRGCAKGKIATDWGEANKNIYPRRVG
jgi:hypothetical protein